MGFDDSNLQTLRLAAREDASNDEGNQNHSEHACYQVSFHCGTWSAEKCGR
jgi:hypothetical protein